MDAHIYWIVAVSFHCVSAMATNRTNSTVLETPKKGNMTKRGCALAGSAHRRGKNLRKHYVNFRRQEEDETYHPLRPKRNETYNPNLGYEPYWPGGEWVFIRLPRDDEFNMHNKTMCGSDCPALYIRYGPVCGINKWRTYRSFQTVCELRNQDCTGDEEWTISYRGKCLEDFTTAPTYVPYMKTRASRYIAEFLGRRLTTVDEEKEKWFVTINSFELDIATTTKNPVATTKKRRRVGRQGWHQNKLLRRLGFRVIKEKKTHSSLPTEITENSI